MTAACCNIDDIQIVAKKSRIEGYDFARALAIMFMMVINFESIIADEIGPEWLINAVLMIEGRAVPIFMILAGIGVSLMTKRLLDSGEKGRNEANSILLKRGLFLFTAGMMLRFTWRADILHYYGIFLISSIFFIRLPNKWLWTFIILSILVSIAYMVGFEVYENLDWDKFTDPDLRYLSEILRHIFLLGFYPFFPWISLFLLGVWLGRLNMSSPYLKISIIMTGFLVFALSEFTSIQLQNNIIDYAYENDKYSLLYLAEIEAFPATPLYLLSSAGISLVVIAFSLILTEALPNNIMVKNFIAAGQLSLTLYAAHIIIGINGLKIIGYGSGQTMLFSVICSAIFFIASLFFSHYWKIHFDKGPLERIMRSVSKPSDSFESNNGMLKNNQ